MAADVAAGVSDTGAQSATTASRVHACNAQQQAANSIRDASVEREAGLVVPSGPWGESAIIAGVIMRST